MSIQELVKSKITKMSKPIELREADFKKEVWEQKFPETVKDEFFQYWTEPNKSGTKMRFELEKTWHLGRRIARWANNGFGTTNKVTGQMTAVKKEVAKTPVNEFERLDAFLAKYAARPADMPFDQFCQWYDFMKAEKLLQPLTKEKVNELQAVYNNDNKKCRCACVQITLDGYVNAGWTVKMVVDLRNRL